jgi:hypothetical protein
MAVCELPGQSCRRLADHDQFLKHGALAQLVLLQIATRNAVDETLDGVERLQYVRQV